MNFLKKLFCDHKDMEFVANVHGDDINRLDGARSLWKCKACGKVEKSRVLGEMKTFRHGYIETLKGGEDA